MFRFQSRATGMLGQQGRQIERKSGPLFRQSDWHSNGMASRVQLFKDGGGPEGKAVDLFVGGVEFQMQRPDPGWKSTQLNVRKTAMKVERSGSGFGDGDVV